MSARRGCACEHQQEGKEEQEKQKCDPSPGGEGLLPFGGSQSVSQERKRRIRGEIGIGVGDGVVVDSQSEE